MDMRPSRSEEEEERVPILNLIDEYLGERWWLIRGPVNPQEEANYGTSVYIAPGSDGRPMGWVDAVMKQADLESERNALRAAPQIVVNLDEDGVNSVSVMGFEVPAEVVVIERDYTRGNDADAQGNLYVDERKDLLRFPKEARNG